MIGGSTDLGVAHPADQGEPAGLIARVEPLDVFDGHLRGGARADLEPDRVGQQLGKRDVRAVQLPGPLAHPQEVPGQVVEPGLVVAGVHPQHGPLVVQQQRLVRGEDVDLVQ
jgi:hypothetical protein